MHARADEQVHACVDEQLHARADEQVHACVDEQLRAVGVHAHQTYSRHAGS
jgi:hypothetical protein